ncbi:solute carrier family 2, facilitated glucose transporter member 5-like [Diadema antillarum]|uniref:solute carrier family 2, facilitated glucose transporter member 5-like n=1 Tax=Diadema antillarum TaxID=105358 RepID=UPI003A86915C
MARYQQVEAEETQPPTREVERDLLAQIQSSQQGGGTDYRRNLSLWLVISTATVCTGSSMEFGYNIGVIAGPSVFIKEFFNRTYYERSGELLSDDSITWIWAAAVSIYCIGGALGALVGGYWADKFGRNRGLLYNNFISVVAAVLMGCCDVANSPEMLIIGRFVIGFSVGISITIVPMYLAEIAPLNLRGAISVSHQLLITVGILLGLCLGFFAFNDEAMWSAVLALTVVTSIIEFIVLPFCPESPRWLLIVKDERDEAIKALRQLRGNGNIQEEILEMEREHGNETEVERVGVSDLICLRDRAWLLPLLICVVIHLGQQLSGINAIIFYSWELYNAAGMSEKEIAYATVGFGALNVCVTTVSVLVVERVGRRPLLLYPFGIIALWLVGLTVCLALQGQYEWLKWMSLVFVYLYIITFAIGPAPLPYLISAELWSQGPRPSALSVSIQVNWWTNFAVQLTFPPIQAAIGQYVFLIYDVCAIATTAFIYFYLPETRKRSFDEIASVFRDRVEGGARNKRQIEMSSYDPQ